MNAKTKKFFALAAGLALSLGSTVFAACGDGGQSNTDGGDGTQGGEPQNAEITLPEPLASYSFEDVKDYSTLNSATGGYDKLNYIFSPENADKLFKAPSAPLVKKGVSGNALYMDGFSTSVETAGFATPSSAITVAAWVAPRVFENLPYYPGECLAAGHTKLTGIVNEGNVQEGKGFILGYGRLGIWGFQICLKHVGKNDNFVYGFYDPINALPLYEWSHVAAAFDGNTGYVSLSLNGQKVYEDVIPELKDTTIIDSSVTQGIVPKDGYGNLIDEIRFRDDGKLHIGTYVSPLLGEYRTENIEDCVTRQTVAGLIDEVNVYGEALTPAQLNKLYSNVAKDGVHPALDYADIALDSSQYEGDRYRPQYHALPPAVWMNEPHSPFYYKGRYHVFYQCNPAGPYWSQIRWGHIVSDDMVHWQYVKDALVPTKGICPDGIWTGGACIGPDGTPWLAITAGTRAGEETTWSNQSVAFAHCADPDDPDLTEWVVEETVTITQPDDDSLGQIHQFRDPFVWYDDETAQYFMLVSSSIKVDGVEKGTAQAFTSQNMHEWEYRGKLFTSDDPMAGEHWECIVLLPIHTKDGSKTRYVLFDCPQYARAGAPGVECWYWVGDFDKENCRFIADDADSAKLFDEGSDTFTGQNGYCFLTDEERAEGKTYEEGRTVIYSIAQGKNINPLRFKYAGWAHNFTFPIELWLGDDGATLMRAPIEEIEGVCGDVLYNYSDEEGMSAEEANALIADVRGDTLMIETEFTIDPTAADFTAKLGVRYNLREINGETERTYLDFSGGIFNLDRLKSTQMQGCTTASRHEWNYGGERTFKVTVLLDRCMIEVFINDTVNATGRIYPMYGDSDYIRFEDLNAGMNITKLKITSMNSAYTGETPAAPYFGNTGNYADK